MHYSFLPQFTSSFSAKPGTNNRPKVRFSASTAELSKFSEYNVPMTREMLHGDTFERRLESSSGKTVDTRQFADLVVQSINGFRQAPKRHFLVTAEGNGATGKTTTIQRLSDFIEQTDSADIKPITVSQGRTEMLDPHKQELESGKVALLWDEYQLSSFSNPFKTPLTRKMLTNDRLSLVAFVPSAGLYNEDFDDKSRKQLLRLFPEENRYTLKKPTPDELVSVFDYMIMHARFAPLTGPQIEELKTRFFKENDPFVLNPQFTQVIQNICRSLEVRGIGSRNNHVPESIPFNIITDSFQNYADKASRIRSKAA